MSERFSSWNDRHSFVRRIQEGLRGPRLVFVSGRAHGIELDTLFRVDRNVVCPDDELLRKVLQVYEGARRYIFVALYGCCDIFLVGKALVAGETLGSGSPIRADREVTH